MSAADTLRWLASAAHAASGLVPHPIAAAAAAALGFAGDLAAMGKDPVTEIRRMRDLDPELARIHAGWRETWKARQGGDRGPRG